MFSSGTTPPAVTLSGTLTIAAPVYVKITTGGARGTAIFSYGVDSNGVNFIETGKTTAATYAMIGSATGLTLNFPVGTYTNNNVYQAVPATLRDKTANGFDMAVTGVPRLWSAWSGGQLGIKMDGTTDRWTNANNIVSSAGSSYAVISVAQVGLNGGTLFCTRSATKYWCEQVFLTNCFVYGNGVDAGANTTIADPTPEKLSPFWVIHQNNSSGSAGSIYFNGTSRTITAGSQITETGAAGSIIGSNSRTDQRWRDYIAEIIVTDTGTLTANDRARLAAYVKSLYSI
jgi:hypothetical protein